METLDVRDLPDDQIEFLQQLIEFMRQNPQKPVTLPIDEMETIQLRSWPLGVKRDVSREKIYDYLDE
ncbi:MAG: hypothetical protein OXT74_14530 [Candidatus Poribacteria bacterium]|nr:hypothetical protein [Candidatus Poribacteria bacterium]